MKSKGGVSNEISGVALNSLEYMERAHKEGATVLMMIDSQMFENVVSSSYMDLLTKSHWIVYEGGLIFIMQQINQLRKLARQLRYRLNLQPGGGVAPSNSHENLVNKKNISVSCFKSTFYGFIICRDYQPSNKKIIDSYMKA